MTFGSKVSLIDENSAVERSEPEIRDAVRYSGISKLKLETNQREHARIRLQEILQRSAFSVYETFGGSRGSRMEDISSAAVLRRSVTQLSEFCKVRGKKAQEKSARGPGVAAPI